MRNYGKLALGLNAMFVAFTAFSVMIFQCNGYGEEPAWKEYLGIVELLEAKSNALASFDLTIKTTVSDGISGDDDNDVLLGTSSVRIVFDRSTKHAQWSTKSQSPKSIRDSYGLMEVEGSQATGWSIDRGVKGLNEFESFEDALNESLFPSLVLWAVSRIPTSTNSAKELELLKVALGTGKPAVSRSESKDSVKFVARIQGKSPNHFVIHHHEFSMPDLDPIAYKYSRAIDGTPVVYFTNEIVWKDQAGITVPELVFAENARLVIKDGKRLRGERKIVMELKWSKLNQEVEFLDTTEKEPTLDRVLKFFWPPE